MRYFTPLFPAGEIRQSQVNSKSRKVWVVNKSSVMRRISFALSGSCLRWSRHLPGGIFGARIGPTLHGVSVEQKNPAVLPLGGRQGVLGGGGQGAGEE